MNKKIIWGVLIIIVLAVAGWYLFKPLQPTSEQPISVAATPTINNTQVTIMVPNDLAAYEKAINEYVSSGGVDPSKTWPFVTKTFPASQTTDVIMASAEAAAEQIHTQASSVKPQVAYFKVVNGTAYVLLTIDIDGWAGVSFAIAKIHPLVEKTLLQFPDVKSVKFAPAPGDSWDS